MNKRNCTNCGAPITTEICPYCNVMTGLDTKHADMEYPVIECKEANVGFWNVVFPMIFSVLFGGPCIAMPLLFLSMGPPEMANFIKIPDFNHISRILYNFYSPI